MSTNIKPETDEYDISLRKGQHLEICTGDRGIESSSKNLFSQIDFLHNAFPELDPSGVDTQIDFLGKKIAMPVFISCMTGGTLQGMGVNVELAMAAEEYKIPVGMGSFRIILTQPHCFDHFALKKYAPSVPVIGNIGAAQLRDTDKKQILAVAGDLGVDAVAVHINPGQEFFQPEGDTDFSGLKSHVLEFIAMSGLPVIVKETGCGFTGRIIDELLSAGAAWIDVAGAGGTNWISVERERCEGPDRNAAREFAEWGIPTAVILYNNRKKKLLASGGIHSGMDAVKAVALGARCAGMARPFINAWANGGRAAVADFIRQIKTVFKAVMTLTGCGNIAALQKTTLVFSKHFLDLAESYQKAER